MAITYEPTYAAQPAGLIGTAGQFTPAVPAETEPYKATTRDIRPEELTQNQLLNITSSGSPLMQRAAAQGRAQAARRGLINSSLSAGSAQNAVIENALPVAQSDAEAYRRAAEQNQQYENVAGQAGAEQAFQRAGESAKYVNLANEQAAQGALDLEKLAREYSFRDAQLQLQNELAKEQVGLAQGNELQKAYVAQSNSLMNNYLNGWFKIQDSQMTPEQKTAALQEYNSTIRTWQDTLNTAYSSLPAWGEDWGIVFT